MSLLLTRPYPQAEETASQLREAGYRVLIAPAITVGESPEAANLIAPLTDELCIILTSRVALEAAARHGLPHSTQLYVTGQPLGELARQRGYRRVISAGGNARSLYERLLRDFPDPQQAPKIVWLCGNHRSFALDAALCEAGYHVQAREVYHSQPAEALSEMAVTALKRGTIAAVLLYSRLSAQSFEQLATRHEVPLHTTTALCISEAIAQTLTRPDWADIHISDGPAIDNVLSCLQQ